MGSSKFATQCSKHKVAINTLTWCYTSRGIRGKHKDPRKVNIVTTLHPPSSGASTIRLALRLFGGAQSRRTLPAVIQYVSPVNKSA